MSGGVLPDHEIERWSAPEFGLVEPYDSEQLSPSSYDVKLAPVILVPRATARAVDLRGPIQQVSDTADIGQEGWMLRPGGFVLGSTVEKVNVPSHMVCRIEGKSSLARAGLQIHSAGYIDPGYRGNVTLEITNFGPDPIQLWPHVLIAQLSFEYLSSGCRTPYSGRYQDSHGAVTSRYNSHSVETPSHDA